MRNLALLALLASSVLAVACDPVSRFQGPNAAAAANRPASPSGTAALADDAAIREQLMKADRDFNDATQSRGREGARSFLAEEFRMIGGRSIESGPDALLKQWEDVFAGKEKLSWAPVAASYLPEAGVGVTTGKWTRVASDPGPKSGRYTTWWRRQADGSWKAIGDGGSADCVPCAASK